MQSNRVAGAGQNDGDGRADIADTPHKDRRLP
jgi:hypothetical protein